MAISDYLPLLQSGAEIFSRFATKNREEKNAKRISNAVDARAKLDADTQRRFMEQLQSQSLGTLNDVYGDPQGSEAVLSNALLNRFAAVNPGNDLPAVQQGRSFSGAMNASRNYNQGLLNADVGGTAADISRLTAPAIADKEARRALELADINQMPIRQMANLQNSITGMGRQAEANRAYKPAGVSENLSTYVDSAVNGGKALYDLLKPKNVYGPVRPNAAQRFFGKFR